MKIKYVVLFFAILFMGCEEETIQVAEQTNSSIADTNTIGCVGSYETLENGEMINREYGRKKIKHGHWINYVMTVQKKDRSRTGSGHVKMIRAKMEEGNYRYGKKQGFWKYYNDDGTCRDSVQFHDGVPSLKVLQTSSGIYSNLK